MRGERKSATVIVHFPLLYSITADNHRRYSLRLIGCIKGHIFTMVSFTVKRGTRALSEGSSSGYKNSVIVYFIN